MKDKLKKIMDTAIEQIDATEQLVEIEHKL